MSGPGPSSIPLPAACSRAQPAVGTGTALVAAFVAATAGTGEDEAAGLAGVRVQTLRKWRRRPPRWLKASTARRLAAFLAGESAPPREDDGFRRAFHLRLREAPPE